MHVIYIYMYPHGFVLIKNNVQVSGFTAVVNVLKGFIVNDISCLPTRRMNEKNFSEPTLEQAT